MRNRGGGWVPAIIACGALLAAGVRTAQSQSDSEPKPAPFTYGLIGGGAQLAVAGSMEAFAGIVQYEPAAWLAFAVNPAYLRITEPTSTGGNVTTSGLGDLPLSAAATFAIPHVAGSPSVGAGAIVSLPTGDSAAGLGSGSTGVAGEFGVGIAPASAWYLYLSAWHPFSGYGTIAGSGSHPTSLGIEGSYEWSERFTTSIGYSADVGHADSGYVLPASLIAGVVIGVAKPLVLTVNAAYGVTSGAAPWLLSVGIGTAFSEISPIGPGSLVNRLQQSAGRAFQNGRGRCAHHAC